MKPRYVDFLSDAEYRSLESTRADKRMYVVGMVCMTLMLAICVTFMTL